MTYPNADPSPTKSSRLALAVVLSTMSVAAIAGPLAYQAIEARDVNVGPASNSTELVPDVGGVTTQQSTAALIETLPEEPEIESTAMVADSADDETVVSSAPTGTQAPAASTAPPSTTPPDTALPPPTVSSDPPSAERSSTETVDPDETSSPSLQIPSSPGTSPTWIPTYSGPTNPDAPTTTSPNASPDRSDLPPSTDGSTSGSVTTAGPAVPSTTVLDPLEPVDPDPTTSTTLAATTTVVTEPLEPESTTTTAPTTTTEGTGSTSTASNGSTTTVAEPTTTSEGDESSSTAP